MKEALLSLAGNWRVRSEDGAYELEVPVPGSLMAALERDGFFGTGGLFYRENNRKALDIARRAFVFTRDVHIDPSFLGSFPHSRFFLEADGLDTLATIRVNGAEIASTANMHRRYRFDVGAALVPGVNRFELRFGDALSYCERKQAERSLWHAYWRLPDYAFQGFNRIRKSHCSFGWDWGPIVPDVGVWRDLRLVRRDGARLGTPLVLQDHRDGAVALRVSAPVECWLPDAGGLSLSLELRDPDGRLVASERSVPGSIRPNSTSSVEFSVEVPAPRLWWPAGLGGQPLYSVSAVLSSVPDAVESGPRRLDSRTLSIGLRTLGVRREKDQWGESFAFEANGVPFFARGGDWIPEDVFLSRADHPKIERLIADAVRANFNCLRVWGGGVYPSDYFYELCDRYGLVVWQDLMFACATYDVRDPDFMAEIEAEVADNLERLRHHASLGLVCGNNEMEQGFVDWGFPHTNEMKTEYLKQYQWVFPRVAEETAPQAFYWPASPSSGGDFENPNDPDRGDTHFWEVWHGNKDFNEYEKHFFRFMSEFGFESFPSIRTIESFTLPEDRNIFSPVMEDHQRCVGGNQKIFNYLAKYFRFPRDFASLVYLSQLSQAEAMRYGTEHWRRNRGRCMGAVYWQYNDNWPVASWSSVDYYGRWKALQYRAKVFFANALLSCPVEGRRIELHLSNEHRRPIAGKVSWRLADASGATVEEGTFPARADALSSVRLMEKDFSSIGRSSRELLFFYRFEGGDGTVSEGAAAFVPFKSLELRVPAYSLRAGTAKDGRTVLLVRSDVPALFAEIVCVDRDLLFSDNFFHLDGRSEKTVVVERGELLPEEAAKVLSVFSLRDSF